MFITFQFSCFFVFTNFVSRVFFRMNFATFCSEKAFAIFLFLHHARTHRLCDGDPTETSDMTGVDQV